MEDLLIHGICVDVARQGLTQDPEEGNARDQLLAQVYERLEECLSPATECQAVREVSSNDDLLAALLVMIRSRCAVMPKVRASAQMLLQPGCTGWPC